MICTDTTILIDTTTTYLRRMKEQENLEAAYARRRRRELQERELFERRRQQILAEKEIKLRELKRQQQFLAYQQQQKQQEQERQQQRQQQEYYDENDDDYSVDIFRWRDGNLYYVKRPIKARRKVQPTITEEIIDHQLPRQEFRPQHANVLEEDSESDYDDESAEESDADLVNVKLLKPQQKYDKSLRRNSCKHLITVTVEDASDSECENEFDSPWRNRRPSPGQWMEPVEPYYG